MYPWGNSICPWCKMSITCHSDQDACADFESRKIKSTAGSFCITKGILKAVITLLLYLIFLNRAKKLCFYVSVPCSCALIAKDGRSKCSLNTSETNCFAEVAAEGEEEHWSLSIPTKLSSNRSSAVQLCTPELRRDRMCLTLLPYAIRRNTIRESPRTDPSASAPSTPLKIGSMWTTRSL